MSIYTILFKYLLFQLRNLKVEITEYKSVVGFFDEFFNLERLWLESPRKKDKTIVIMRWYSTNSLILSAVLNNPI